MLDVSISCAARRGACGSLVRVDQWCHIPVGPATEPPPRVDAGQVDGTPRASPTGMAGRPRRMPLVWKWLTAGASITLASGVLAGWVSRARRINTLSR
jgi:hypothetical protein